MDLKKFLTRQRIETNAILSLLTGRQSYFIDRMSQMVVRESSNFEWTSSDNQLSDSNKKNEMDENVTSITRSSDKVDKRLVNLYIF